MTVHDQARDLASAALDFDLTRTERAELDDHLTSCAACAAFAIGLRRDIEVASAWPTFEVPVRVRQTVFAALEGPASISQPRVIGRLSLGLAVLLLAILVFLALVIGSTRGPSGLLAVVEGTNVYTVDMASDRRSVLATVSPPPSGQFQWPVRWSADGRRIFVGASRSIGTDGTDEVVAVGGPDGSWSPDGSLYAVQAGDHGVAILIVDRSGAWVAAPIPLPPGVGDLVGVPTWSPDGRWLALVGCAPNPCNGLDGPGVTYDVWIVAVDGSSVRRLTPPEPTQQQTLSWSPDSSRIAFGRFAVEPYSPTCRTPLTVPSADRLCLVRAQLFVTLIADGTTLEIGSPSTFMGDPAWAPDGQRLAFEVGELDGTSRIETANVDGSGMHRISAGPFDALPVWSGDGRWLAYATSRTATSTELTDYDVWIIRADGTGARMVAAGTFVFAWQPSR